jgi:hypothetical protein
LLTDTLLPDFCEIALLAPIPEILIGHRDDVAMFRLQNGGVSSDGGGEIDDGW